MGLTQHTTNKLMPCLRGDETKYLDSRASLRCDPMLFPLGAAKKQLETKMNILLIGLRKMGEAMQLQWLDNITYQFTIASPTATDRPAGR
jgi:hypothetical protein